MDLYILKSATVCVFDIWNLICSGFLSLNPMQIILSLISVLLFFLIIYFFPLLLFFNCTIIYYN